MLLLADPWPNSSVQHIHLCHPPPLSVSSPKTPGQTALIPLSLSLGKLGVLVICLDIIYNEIFHHLTTANLRWHFMVCLWQEVVSSSYVSNSSWLCGLGDHSGVQYFKSCWFFVYLWSSPVYPHRISWVLRDVFQASWLSQEDNIVETLFFHTSHDFLLPDVDIYIVLTSVRKRELFWSGSGKVKKTPWKWIGGNMHICRAKRCLLSSLALWIFVRRSMDVSHSIYKPRLLDLPADHASSKGGADLNIYI